MSLEWIHEGPGRWDADKQRIVGGAPTGALVVPAAKAGDKVPGDWWRVQESGKTLGYGWMDSTWEGAEILLAVDPASRKHGVGTFIVDRLEREAAARNLNYLFNTVKPTHPDRANVTRWLENRGFTATADGELRRRVHRS